MSQIRVKDYTGKVIHKKKRGFATKKEALEWERDFLNKATADMGMLFQDFVELYFEDMSHRLKESTIISKHYMVDKKILPVFRKIPINEITIPQTLANCLKEYMDKCYEIQPDDRLFPYTKSFLNHEMLRGCKKSGVKKIRVHDLRHSHASLLIEMGCQPLLIADRLGHEKIQTTLNTYSHLYPNKQAEVAAQLENVMNGTTVPNGSQMAGVANL